MFAKNKFCVTISAKGGLLGLITKKDFNGYAKRYGIAVLCAIPVLIALDFWILPKIGNVWTIVVDCVLILLAFALTLLFSRMWRDHITKKRTEFLNKKDAQKRQELVENAAAKAQENEAPQKIWQKQKKDYPTNKRKK